MLRFNINRGVLFAFGLPFSSYNSYDVDRIKKKNVSDPADVDPLKFSGVDKLRHMFMKSDGDLTKETQSIISATSICFVGSFVLGGFANAVKISKEFIKENETNKFLSIADARKQLNNRMFLEFMNKGTSYAWRVGLFGFLNQTIGVSLYTYRGKHEIKNYTIAGAITASLFKMHLGLKGFVSAGIIGGLFGTLYGSISKGLLYLGGVEIDEVYDAHLQFIENRRNKIKHGKVDDETKAIIQQYEETRKLKEMLEAKPEQTKTAL